MNVKPISASQVHWETPQAAMEVTGQPDWPTRFHMQMYEDDLDEIQAAYFLVGDVPFSVQRHAGNPANTYTIMFDASLAKRKWARRVGRLAEELLKHMGSGPKSVLWENSNLMRG